MVIEQHKNLALKGKHQRPIVTDVFYTPDDKKKQVLIFCHGYKGFKDWGAWNMMAEAFANNGFFFVKFNFSHNGGTIEDPIDFPDLDAFKRNTYTKEMDDLEVVLDWINADDNPYAAFIDTEQIAIMGHSRGGGSAIIKAQEDQRVKKLITLAAVSDFGNRFPTGKELKHWKEHGVGYTENTRTKQKMPHLYSFYTDYMENQTRFDISRATKRLRIPFLIIHGTQDPTVDISNAHDLSQWNPQAEMFILQGSDHVFGASHPWKEPSLPQAIDKIINKVTEFIG